MGELLAVGADEFFGEDRKVNLFRYALLYRHLPIFCYGCGSEIVFLNDGQKIDFLYFAYNALCNDEKLLRFLGRHADCMREFIFEGTAP